MNNDHLTGPMLSASMDEVIRLRTRIEALEAARDVVEKKLRGLSAQWALHGGPFDHAWISEVMAAPEPDK